MLRDQKGGLYVEATVIIPVLILTILAGIEIMMISYKAAGLEYVTSQAIRKLALGICQEVGGVETTACPAGTTDPKVRRAEYALEYANLLANRFGLNILSGTSIKPGVHVCISEVTSSSSNCTTNQIVGANPEDIAAMQIQIPMEQVGFFGGHFIGGKALTGYAISYVEQIN